MKRIDTVLPARLLALLTTAAILASALPAHAADTSLPLCQALADNYSALLKRNPDAALEPASAGNTLRSIYPMSPVQALAKDAGGGLKLAETIITLTDYTDDAFADAAGKLPEAFTPSDALLKEMSGDENQYVEIQHLAGTPYYLARAVEGTASCAVTTWFTVAAGRAKPLAGPKSWEPTDGGGNCGIDATFGSLDGKLVAIIDTGGNLTPDLSASATLTAHTQEGWAPDCTSTFDFAPRFDPEHVVNPPDKAADACTGPDCLKLRDAVLVLLKAFQDGPQAAQKQQLAALSGAQKAAFDKMKLAWKPDGDSTDNPSPQMSDAPGDVLDSQPFALPLLVDDKLYLALIGHRTIGWRVYGDYNIDVYALKGEALDQVRSFQMGMAQGRLLKATAKEGPN
jgi:hypothetical protein